jgi:hypothetical protein
MFLHLNLLLYLLLTIPSCVNRSNKAEPLNITISYSPNAAKIEPLTYGASTSSMYWQTDAASDKFISLVDSLDLNVLRWPGGTLAQFYHWNKAGYGLNLNEIKAIHPAYANSLKNQNAYVDEKTFTRRYVDDFVMLAQKTQSKVLVCANMVTASDEENLALLDFFQSRNLNICGVELGNELYLPRMRGVFNNDVQNYITRAKTLAEKIRARYPNIPLAVCAAPIRDIADENPPEGSEAAYFNDWNQQLSKNNFYDAVVLHYYFPIPCSGSISTIFNCAFDEILNINTKIFPATIDIYRNIFGNKPYWITEWNIATKSTQGRYGNTLLQNLFITQFYDAINTVNQKYPRQITVATYQTLAGDIFGTCMIMDKNKRETFTDNAADPYIRKASYYAHLMLKGNYTGELIMCEVNCNRKNVYCSAYFNKSNGKLIVLFQNKDTEQFKINSLTVNGKSVPEQNVIVGTCLQSNNLYDGFGLNKADGELTNRNTPNIILIQDVLKNISISKYSFGYLQVTL